MKIPGIGQSIFEVYGGEAVSVLINGSSGRRMYSDFEHEEMIIIKGTIKSGHGDVLILQCDDGEVLVNGYQVRAVMKKSEGELADLLNVQIKKSSKR
jgi:hypothetical protein